MRKKHRSWCSIQPPPPPDLKGELISNYLDIPQKRTLFPLSFVQNKGKCLVNLLWLFESWFSFVGPMGSENIAVPM